MACDARLEETALLWLGSGAVGARLTAVALPQADVLNLLPLCPALQKIDVLAPRVRDPDAFLERVAACCRQLRKLKVRERERER